MQVNHVADNVTHAVIGNKQARDFGISDSAEFFNILSNTLYSDKILAVVREVLCNAWDIHIQTGRTDTPVEVMLADGKLTIQDFGTGISDDDIHPIYAVYGNSTKKLDGTQTGGFGLGSKAPFAYVDHFEVTSYYGGMKTIYAVSKSSAEVAGKPSLMPLLSVPCGDETGLCVSMSVKPEDRSRFEQVIRTIAKFGEMHVMFKGDRGEPALLPTIPFTQAKHGFLMTRDVEGISGAQNHRVYARYGNVVYPIPDHEKIKSEYARIVEIMSKIGNDRGHWNQSNGGPWKIVFQARPDTISVTPSRESLSMTDHTVGSIKELFEAFVKLTDADLRDACLQIERECIETVWKKGRVADLLTSDNKVPTLFDPAADYYTQNKAIVEEATYISDISQMGRSYMSKAYPDFPNFRREDMNMRLEIIEKSGIGDVKNRGKIQSWRREYAQHGNTKGAEWFQRTLVNPLVKRLDAIPELSGSKLLVYGKHSDLSTDKNGRVRNYGDGKKFVEATKLSVRNLEDYLPFLRNIAIISFNRIDVEERLPKFPIFKEQLGDCEDFFMYVVSRTDKKIDIVRQFFADQGMTVVDLTQRQDWEPAHIMTPIPKVVSVKKPRKKGLPMLSELIQKEINPRYAGDRPFKLDYTRFGGAENMDTVKRIEDPSFVVQFNPRAQSADLLYGLNGTSKMAIVQLYGSIGGVTVNDNQFSRFTSELKIPSLRDWLLAKIKEEVLTNPRLQPVFGYNIEHMPDDIIRNLIVEKHSKFALFRMILMNPDLAIEFGVLNEMTPDDKLIFEIISDLTSGRNYHWYRDPVVLEMRKHIDAIAPEQEVQDLARKIANSELTELLRTDHFSGIFGETPDSSQKMQRSGALDVLQYVLA